MSSDGSSFDVKREVKTPPLSDVPPGPDDTVYTGSDVDSSAKTEPKTEEQDDKTLVKRQVIYFWFSNWCGRYWHLMGDGANFQFGYTENSSPSNFLQSLKMTLPARVDGLDAISGLMPRLEEPFWTECQQSRRAQKDMLARVVDSILEIRLNCGYADAQHAPRLMTPNVPYQFFRLPGDTEIDFAGLEASGLWTALTTWIVQVQDVVYIP